MPVEKETIDQFAQRIKTKYPEYKDKDNADLVNRFVAKYPVYKDKVNFEQQQPTPAQPAPAAQPTPEQPKSEMMSADISQYTNVKAPSEKQPVSVPSTEMPDYEGAANRTVKNINDHLDKTLLKINNNATDRAFKEVVQKHKLGEINDEEYNKAQSAYLGEVLINKDQRLAEAKDLMNQDPQYKAKVIQKIADDNPKIAKELKADNYILEAQKRPHDPFLVAANAREIKRGQLDFSIEHGQLTKNLDFAQSIGAAYNQRNKTLDDFDFYNNATPEDAIKHLDEKLSEYHPDKPVDIPGPVGGAIGSQGILMAKGAGTAVGVSLLGAPEAAPWAAAAAVSPEIYKTSYTNALERNYADILSNNPNISKRDAYKQADERAVFEAKADVAAGIAMSVAGGRIGLKGFKPRELSPQFIKITQNIANHVAQTGIEGSGAAAAAGTAEVLKNIHNEKPIGENVGEAVKGQLLLAYGMGLLTHAGSKLVSPKTRQMVLQNVAKLPEDVANKTLGDLVSTGKVSPEEANDIHTEIKTQRENDLKIPNSVKSDAARADIHKMLQKREDLEVRLENQSKAFAPETKEKITALDEKINETAKNGKQHDEDSKVELPFPKAEEKPSISIGDKVQWTSQGSYQFSEPRKVTSISDDGKYAFVEGSVTGIPIEQLNKHGEKTSANIPSNVETTDQYRTANVGNHEGEKEFILDGGELKKDEAHQTDLKKQQVENISKWNVPLDEGTPNPKGETMGQVVGRVVGQYIKDKETRPNNSWISTHSSVLKVIKTYEALKDRPEFKNADWNNLTEEQHKIFADHYNSESTNNGDVETFDSKNGKIHIVRHGQTEDNLTGKFRDQNTQLTEKGREQAYNAAEELFKRTGGDIGESVSSDLGRAVETQKIINDRLKELQNNKNKANAVQESGSGSVLQHPQEGVGSEGGERGRMEPSVEGEKTSEEGKTTGEEEKVNPLESITGKPAETIGITHERMNELSRELGIPEYEESPETVAAWDKEADTRIAKDPQAISKLLNKMRNGNMPDHVEQRMILKYVSDLKARWNESKSDELLTQIKRVKDLSNVMGGRAVGKSLRARQDEIPVEKTLPDYMIREMEASGVDHLTEGQKKQATKDFENISGAEEDYKAKAEKLEAEVAKLKAEKAFGKIKTEKKPTEKKTKEDYAAERKSIIEEYKKKKESDTTKRQGAPITDEDVKLVAKLLKSYVEEGVDNLKEAVSKIHETVKDAIEGISEKDIHNIIAGEYAAKKQTRSELMSKIKDLKDEAALINRLEKIQSGEEPKSPKKQIERNKSIKELQDKISALKIKNPLTEEEKNIIRLEKQLDDIRSGNIKQPSVNRQLSEREKELHDEIFNAKKELGLIPSKPLPPKPEAELTPAEKSIKRKEKELEDLRSGIVKQQSERREPTQEEKDLDELIHEEKKKLGLIPSKPLPPKPEAELTPKEKNIKRLEKELDDLRNGIVKQKSEKREVSDEEKELKEKIADAKEKLGLIPSKPLEEHPEDLRDQRSLKTIKSRNEAELKRVQEQIDKGNFEPDKKKQSVFEREEIQQKYPELYKQALNARDKVIKLKQEREIRLIKQQFSNKNRYQKFGHYLLQILNTPRTLMSSVDFSAPLRQGIIPTVAHPDLALRAFGLMFKTAFSQGAFDKWFFSLRDSPEFKIMKDSGLYVADPHDFRLTAREEAFMSNLAERIPIAGKLVAGSERAYVAYLNKMRVDMFNRGADILSSEGHTIKNSKEEYEALARWVNNATGRGNFNPALQNAAPILNSVFFSPRLIASRVNLLTQWVNPSYYKNTPGSIRVMAIKDMAKFIGFGLTVLAVAKTGGAEVEESPLSTDFGKIKVGNTRYDIWGGFQPYIRMAAQIIAGESKSTATGKINQFGGPGSFGRTRADVLGIFARGKLAPIPSMALDFASGRKATGEKVSVTDELKQHFLPLLYSDVEDALKDGGVKSAIAPFAASTFGVSVQTYKPTPKKSTQSKISLQ